MLPSTTVVKMAPVTGVLASAGQDSATTISIKTIVILRFCFIRNPPLLLCFSKESRRRTLRDHPDILRVSPEVYRPTLVSNGYQALSGHGGLLPRSRRLVDWPQTAFWEESYTRLARSPLRSDNSPTGDCYERYRRADWKIAGYDGDQQSRVPAHLPLVKHFVVLI